MAIQFNTNNTGTVYTATTAIDAFRLGLMVNPTTGANVSRAVADQRTDVEAVFGFTTEAEQDANILTISTARSPAAGSYAITDRIIIIDGSAAQLAATTNGCHISFYNCRIMIRQWSTAAGVVLTTPIGTFSSAGTTGAGAGGRETPTNFLAPTTGRSINCYGCTIAVADEGADLHGNVFGNFGDFIGSDITFEGPSVRANGNFVNFTYQTGGRFINSTHVCNPNSTDSNSWNGYSFPSVFEGGRLYDCGMTTGNANTAGSAGSGPRLLTEAQFTYDDQVNYFIVQADNRSGWNQAANAFLQLGFKTPSSNSDRIGVIGTNNFQSAIPAYLDIVNGAGSTYNYLGYQPTYQDLATGNPIENVRVRVATSALKGTAGTTVTTSNWHSQITADNTEKTLGTTFYANEYLTDATGQLVTSRYTQNGWTSAANGSYDPFRFDVRTDTASSQLASLDLDTIVLNAPEHCAPALLQQMKGTATGAGSTTAGFTRHQARYEARSYTHNVSENFTESSTTLPDGSARAINTDYTIDRTVRNDTAREGVTVTETQALALFDAVGSKDVQNVFEFILGNWSTYVTNVEPIVTGNTATWAGQVTINSANSNSLVSGAQVVFNRVSELTAGDIDTLSASAFTVGTDVTGVNLIATGNIDVGTGNAFSNATLTAASYSNFPTTLDGSITFVGTNTFSGTSSLTVTDRSNLGGLTLNVPFGVTLNITGASATDFAAVTGAGTVNYLLAYPIVNERTSGLLTVYRDGVPEIVTTEIPNIQANQVIDVIYSEIGRTDFLQRINTGASPGPVTVTIMNSPTPFPTASPAIGVFTPQTPSAGFMNIMVSESIISEGEVNNALQTQVKATTNYNALIQMTQQVDIISSDGAASTAAADSDHIQFIAVRPISVGYIRSTGADQSSEALAGPTTTGTFTPAGGGGSPSTITVGVVINAPQAFDAAITGGQIEDAVVTINNNTDAELAQVTGDVREMRDNRYLGIRRQPVRT